MGLVSGAVFSDLDADGDSDLVLACEWGPLKVFRNERGRLAAWDAPVGTTNAPRSVLSQFTGLWNSVTAADFDGDGRMDLVAGNWGCGTRQQSHRAQPIELWFGDANGDGVTEVAEAYYDTTLKTVVPERQMDFLARGLPFVRTRFATHMQYGRASLVEILGDKAGEMKRLTASWLESVVLLNRGDHFELRVLPVEAQLAPVFGVVARDFDGDGRVDLFLAQNFFGLQPDVPRLDAGRGLLLRGDGRGGFEALTAKTSGLAIYGEQRGAAAADFDRDGRMDLAVSQNGAETKLYRNTTAKPGLRVRLVGLPGNRDAVGAVVRGEVGGVPGPAFEVHSGAGYWSQDSSTQVLGGSPSRVLVRWPNGARTTNAVPVGTREIVIDGSGKPAVLR
ncbi:MAG: VCBS repeat-containing protein [Verrucomicrobia bacterium]|nr:VCBS repeat-containing protein [Verrucomicrobiota bacterium]